MTDNLELARLCSEAGQLLLRSAQENEDLEREYVRLFLSPSGAPCPPWQSVWAQDGEQPRLLGAAHHSALDWYRRFGFAPSNGAEPADHAGLLLLFYSFLLGSDASDQTRHEFARQHLGWLEKLGESIVANSQLGHFQELGEALIEISSYLGSQTEGPADPQPLPATR